MHDRFHPRPKPPAAVFPRPIGTEDDCYLLRLDRHTYAYTATELANRERLLSLFGGNETWLRECFPIRMYLRDAQSPQSVVIGFDVTAAAQYLMSLCIDAENNRRQSRFPVAARRPGPLDYARAWVNRIAVRLGLRRVVVTAAQ